jgi:hypothetical protein
VEVLEGRAVPAGNLKATFAPRTGTLTVVGTAGDDALGVFGHPGDPTRLDLVAPTESINGGAVGGTYTTPAGVRTVVITTLAGDDSVLFSSPGAGGNGPIRLPGSLTVTGTTGAKSVRASDLTVGGSVSIRSGVHTTGTNTTTLYNLTAGGGVAVRSAGGDTDTQIGRTAAGVSNINGSVTVVNGAGKDFFNLTDMDVGGNLTVANGPGDAAGNAGRFQVYNYYNTGRRAVIRGSVSVSYLSGNGGTDFVQDVEVLGNVTLRHGPGEFITTVDGFHTGLPVQVRGSLTVAGTGRSTVSLGTGDQRTGLVVGGACR